MFVSCMYIYTYTTSGQIWCPLWCYGKCCSSGSYFWGNNPCVWWWKLDNTTIISWGQWYHSCSNWSYTVIELSFCFFHKSLLKIFLNFFPSKVTCFVYLFMICVSLKIKKMDLDMHKIWITTKGKKMEKISAHNINLSFFRKMLQIFKFFNIYFLFSFQF